jgi:hypothetical protein
VRSNARQRRFLRYAHPSAKRCSSSSAARRPTRHSHDGRRQCSLCLDAAPCEAWQIRPHDSPVFLSRRPAATMLRERSDTRCARQAAVLPVRRESDGGVLPRPVLRLDAEFRT